MNAKLVTMVFTDLVNSTDITLKLPGEDAHARNRVYFETVLAPHRRRVEQGLVAAGGRIAMIEGDAYFLAFADAAAAARWALELQRSHAEEAIATPLGPLQVKIGLHVGSPLTDPEDPNQFVGQEVNYAARVRETAHGGQIALSEVAATLVRDACLHGVAIHAHGPRLLKGIGPVPIYELLRTGQVPRPLREPPLTPTNLPLVTGGFFGREGLLAEVCAHLRNDAVTVLKGEGGMGKTALALEAAHAALADGAFPGGLAWIHAEQAPSRDECLRRLAAVFLGNRLEDESIAHCTERVRDHLNRRAALAVLDNFETIAGDPDILTMVAELSRLARVLVTTREVPPSLHGAVVPVRELADEDAVALFAGRARQAGVMLDGDALAQVRELCAAVGGQPLAIELLAARSATLPLARLAARIREDLGVLDARGDARRPERHQSARTCLKVSFENLGAAARDVLLRLSVLPDGASTATLTAVLGREDWDEAVEELVRGSVWRLAGARYTMHPLVRQFALEQVGDRRLELERAAARGLIGFVHMRAQQAQFGAATPERIRAAIDWCERELRNLDFCGRIAFETGDWAAVDQLACAVARFFQVRGYWSVAEALHARALEAARRAGDEAAEARALYHHGLAHYHQGHWADAEARLVEALSLWRGLGDRANEGHTLKHLGRIHQLRGRFGPSEVALREALALLHDAGDAIGEAKTLIYLGNLYRFNQRLDEAREVYERALVLSRQASDRYDEGEVLRHLGRIHQAQGQPEAARECFERSLVIWREFKDRLNEAQNLVALGTLAREQGAWDDAELPLQQGLATFRDFAHRHREGGALHELARLRQAQGRLTEAREFARQAVEILATTEDTVALERSRALLALF
jgi:class 3 adenylate cyclase/tetratricopeptide (TPR) repeat protein